MITACENRVMQQDGRLYGGPSTHEARLDAHMDAIIACAENRSPLGEHIKTKWYDMNHDAFFTISDVGDMFLFPGNWLVENIAGTWFGRFFEFTPALYDSWQVWIISSLLWFFVIGAMFESLSETLDSKGRKARKEGY